MKKHMRIEPTPEQSPEEQAKYKWPEPKHIRLPFTVLDENDRNWGAYEDEEKAQIRCNYVSWLYDLPVGQRGSSPLTDVRAVCSKAWTTVSRAEQYARPRDNEELDIICDLHEVVELLEKYERTKPTGKPPWAHKDPEGHWIYFGDY